MSELIATEQPLAELTLANVNPATPSSPVALATDTDKPLV